MMYLENKVEIFDNELACISHSFWYGYTWCFSYQVPERLHACSLPLVSHFFEHKNHCCFRGCWIRYQSVWKWWNICPEDTYVWSWMCIVGDVIYHPPWLSLLLNYNSCASMLKKWDQLHISTRDILYPLHPCFEFCGVKLQDYDGTLEIKDDRTSQFLHQVRQREICVLGKIGSTAASLFKLLIALTYMVARI